MSQESQENRVQASAEAKELGRSVDRLLEQIRVAQEALDRARVIVEGDTPPTPPPNPRRPRWRFPF